MQQPRDTSAPASNSIYRVILLPLAGLVGLQVIGTFVNDNNFWGVSFWSVLPWWSVVAAVGGYIVLSIPAVSLAIYTLVVLGLQPVGRVWRQVPRPLSWGLAIVVLSTIAWLLRSRALIYGDGFTAMAQAARPLAEAFDTIHDYLRPLTILIHSSSSLAMQYDPAIGAHAFWWASIVGGVFGWLGIFALARSLTRDALGVATILLVTLTSGCIVLFLGWVELYVWPTAFLVWLLATGVRYIRKQGGMGPVILFGILAILSDALLVPVALTVVLMCAKLRGQPWAIKIVPGPRVMFLLLTVSAIVLGTLMNLTGRSFFIVPLLPTADNPYWTFSPRHIVDIANELLLVAPMSAVLMALLLVKRPRLRIFDDPAAALLGLATWACLLLSVWIDPKLGASRDWDLLSFHGLPLSVLVGYLLATQITTDVHRRLVQVQVALIALIVIIPNLYEKTHPGVSIRRVEQLTWNDIHYQPSYLQAYGCISFGSILHEQCGRGDLAEKFFERRVASKRTCDLGWYNLGVVYYAKAQYAKAANCFSHAVEIKPETNKYRNSLLAAQLAEIRGR